MKKLLPAETAFLWPRLWMRWAGLGPLGRIVCAIAALGQPPSYGRVRISRFGPCGYIAPSARICHFDLRLSRSCFIGDRVNIYQDHGGGAVTMGKDVHVHRDSTLHTGDGGLIDIGAHTHIQPRCQVVAFKGTITIGCGCEIAPHCAFYAYDHGFAAGTPVRKQPISTKGGIVLGDDVWLGFGVIILDGVTIGDDAVVGAGSVVTSNIPPRCIAAGNPAQVRKKR